MMYVEDVPELVGGALPLFSLAHIQKFTAVGLDLPVDTYCRIFQDMKELLHLRLGNLDIEPVLDALSISNRGAYGKVIKSILNHLHTRRRTVPTTRPQTAIIDPLCAQCHQRSGLGTVTCPGVEA